MHKNTVDIINQKFDRLTVLEYSHSEKGRIKWKCRCDCGKIRVCVGKELRLGNVTSCGCKRSDSKKGNLNPNWKGNNVGYTALHAWIKSRIKRANCCDRCKSNKPLDLANKSNMYLRDVSDWEWLCRKCHMVTDGRLVSLHYKAHIKIRTKRLCTEDNCGLLHHARGLCTKHYAIRVYYGAYK